MPTLFIITAISESYPDIALNPDKYFFKKKFLYSSAFFTIRASQSHHIGFVVAHSQSFTTASWATSLPLQQF